MSGKRSGFGGGIGAVLILGGVITVMRKIDFDENRAPEPYYQFSEEAELAEKQRLMEEVSKKLRGESMQDLRERQETQPRTNESLDDQKAKTSADSKESQEETESGSTTPSEVSP